MSGVTEVGIVIYDYGIMKEIKEYSKQKSVLIFVFASSLSREIQ